MKNNRDGFKKQTNLYTYFEDEIMTWGVFHERILVHTWGITEFYYDGTQNTGQNIGWTYLKIKTNTNVNLAQT